MYITLKLKNHVTQNFEKGTGYSGRKFRTI